MNNNQRLNNLSHAKRNLDSLDGRDEKVKNAIETVFSSLNGCILSDNINGSWAEYATLYTQVCSAENHIQAYNAIQSALLAAMEEAEKQIKRKSKNSDLFSDSGY